MNTINELNETSTKLYRSYVASNTTDVNQSEQVRELIAQGQTGYDELIKITENLKITAESKGLTVKQACAKIKTQVSRELNKGTTGLSLQGLGVDQTVEIKEKSTTDTDTVEGELVDSAPTPQSLVNPATLSITSEQAWDFVEQYYTLDEVQALLGAVKSRIKAEESEEVKAA